MIADRRTPLAIIFILTLTTYGLGRPLPFDTSAPVPFVIGLVLFFGYLYLFRTLVRLPFAIVITIRRARYARQHYGLDSRESLRDGLARGFLDTRRWSAGQLALIDRLMVFVGVMLATLPFLGTILVNIGGVIGLSLLLILYLFRGNFSFLIDDNIHDDAVQRSALLPFLKTRD